MDYKNVPFVFVQNIIKVFKFQFKNKNLELLDIDELTKFCPTARQKQDFVYQLDKN